MLGANFWNIFFLIDWWIRLNTISQTKERRCCHVQIQALLSSCIVLSDTNTGTNISDFRRNKCNCIKREDKPTHAPR